jgi:hypothetical protein
MIPPYLFDPATGTLRPNDAPPPIDKPAALLALIEYFKCFGKHISGGQKETVWKTCDKLATAIIAEVEEL